MLSAVKDAAAVDVVLKFLFCHAFGAQEMIEEADRDQDGVVNADEFYRVMRKREDPLDDLDSDDEY